MEALANEPHWTFTSFHIEWEQGLRLSETHLNIPGQVDLDRFSTRPSTKGQKDTLVDFRSNPKVVLLFE